MRPGPRGPAQEQTGCPTCEENTISTDDTTTVLIADQGQNSGAAPDDAAVTEAFAERLFDSALGALDLFAIGLGQRLGLYAALHEHGASTSTELAARTGVAERYAREWLEQQAVTGILTVVPDVAQAGRRYALPPALVPALLEPTHPAYVAPPRRPGAARGPAS